MKKNLLITLLLATFTNQTFSQEIEFINDKGVNIDGENEFTNLMNEKGGMYSIQSDEVSFCADLTSQEENNFKTVKIKDLEFQSVKYSDKFTLRNEIVHARIEGDNLKFLYLYKDDKKIYTMLYILNWIIN